MMDLVTCEHDALRQHGGLLLPSALRCHDYVQRFCRSHRPIVSMATGTVVLGDMHWFDGNQDLQVHTPYAVTAGLDCAHACFDIEIDNVFTVCVLTIGKV